jgi:broad specificity phosphatase PhoE
MRHGESEANVKRMFTSDGRDNGLTERGIGQVEQAARELAGVGFDHLYCSPYQRTEETAAIVSEHLGLRPVPDASLREFDVGILNGFCNDECWIRYRNLLVDWLDHGKWDEHIDKGESYNDLIGRFGPFLKRLQTSHPDSSRVLVVGHGGLFRCMLPHFCVNLDGRFALKARLVNTGIINTSIENGSLFCHSWGDMPV